MADETLNEKAEHLLELQAPQILNNAGYGYVGDLLGDLLHEVKELPNENKHSPEPAV